MPAGTVHSKSHILLSYTGGFFLMAGDAFYAFSLFLPGNQDTPTKSILALHLLLWVPVIYSTQLTSFPECFPLLGSSLYAAQAGFELTILLPQTPK